MNCESPIPIPSQLLQLFSLLLTTEAAIFLASAGVGLSPQTIVNLIATKWDANLEVGRALAKQGADTQVGIVLLLVGVAAGISSLGAASGEIGLRPILATVALAAICYLVSIAVRNRKAAHALRSVEALLRARQS